MTITLITGANKGIGFETARQLLAVGHVVYLGARDVERGQQAAAALGARFVQLDVTDDASVNSALAAIDAAEGRLDILVNNAGILGTEPSTAPPPCAPSTPTRSASCGSRKRRCPCCASRRTPPW